MSAARADVKDTTNTIVDVRTFSRVGFMNAYLLSSIERVSGQLTCYSTHKMWMRPAFPQSSCISQLGKCCRATRRRFRARRSQSRSKAVSTWEVPRWELITCRVLVVDQKMRAVDETARGNCRLALFSRFVGIRLAFALAGCRQTHQEPALRRAILMDERRRFVFGEVA
jgi:hypothetical protein